VSEDIAREIPNRTRSRSTASVSCCRAPMARGQPAEGSKRPGDLGTLRHKIKEIIRAAGLRDGLDRQGPWQAPRLDPSAFSGVALRCSR
jgi:hypothetical protein